MATLEELEAADRRFDELERRGLIRSEPATWEGEDETVPPIVVSFDRHGRTLGVQAFRTRAEAEASVAMFRRRRETGRRPLRLTVPRPRAHRTRRTTAPTRGSPASSDESPEPPPSAVWAFIATASRRMLEHERRREAKRALA